jgi:hypothetical protein
MSSLLFALSSLFVPPLWILYPNDYIVIGYDCILCLYGKIQELVKVAASMQDFTVFNQEIL